MVARVASSMASRSSRSGLRTVSRRADFSGLAPSFIMSRGLPPERVVRLCATAFLFRAESLRNQHLLRLYTDTGVFSVAFGFERKLKASFNELFLLAPFFRRSRARPGARDRVFYSTGIPAEPTCSLFDSEKNQTLRHHLLMSSTFRSSFLQALFSKISRSLYL